ncbi:hypothetical protein [Oceanibacterium hippocampi]|nr:hypothetical protein [Oceanibacterium hippocampi]
MAPYTSTATLFRRDAGGGVSLGTRTARKVRHHEIGELAGLLKHMGETQARAVDALLAGSIQVLGLDEVRERYAADWARLEARIGEIVETFIASRLGKQDLLIPLGTQQFAIVFAELSRDEARAQARKIAGQLANHLFGQVPHGELISVEGLAMTLDELEGLDEVTSVEDLVRCFKAAQDRQRGREVEAIEAAQSQLGFRFWPTVNVSKRMISIYECAATRDGPDGASMLAPDDPVIPASGDGRSEFDLLVLQEAGTHLGSLGGLMHKALLMVPVHFETLAARYHRTAYVEALKELPGAGERRLILKIEGLPDGTPNTRLRQIVTSIKPLVMGTVWQVEPDFAHFQALEGLHALGIALDGRRVARLERLEKLVATASRAGLRPFLGAIGTTDAATTACRLGFRYLNGRALAPMLHRPGPACRLA